MLVDADACAQVRERTAAEREIALDLVEDPRVDVVGRNPTSTSRSRTVVSALMAGNLISGSSEANPTVKIWIKTSASEFNCEPLNSDILPLPNCDARPLTQTIPLDTFAMNAERAWRCGQPRLEGRLP